MATATLTFDLSVPEDAARFELYSQAERMYHVLWELTNHDLRQIDKYDDMSLFSHAAREFLFEIDGGTPVTIKTTPGKVDGGTMVSMLRTFLHEKLAENQVNLDVLS